MKAIAHQDHPPEAWRPGVETRMLISAVNGAAQLCIFEQWVAPGAGAPTHRHTVEEVLTVCEGEAEMWIEEQRAIVPAGQSLIVPAGRNHGFRNSGASLSLLDELDVVAILVELCDVPLAPRDALLRQQHVGHGDGAKLRLANEALVVGPLLGADVDMDIDVADRALPGRIALRRLQVFRREYEIHR